MHSQQLQEVATGWIAYQHSWDIDPASQKTTSLQWAYDAALAILKESAEDSWQLILRIHLQDQSEPIRQILSASLFEDFMELYGSGYIDQVEEQVAKEPSFAGIVAGIYKARITDDVWLRLEPIKTRWQS